MGEARKPFGYLKPALTDAPFADNPSGLYCPSCRKAGLAHCSEPEWCGGMRRMRALPSDLAQGWIQIWSDNSANWWGDKELAEAHVATSKVPGSRVAFVREVDPEAATRISSLEEENKRLREALRPFAAIVAEASPDKVDTVWPDDPDHWTARDHTWGQRITVGNLRRAREAIGE